MRRTFVLLLACSTMAFGAGCNSDDDPVGPDLRPGTYDVRLRFFDVEGKPPCFESGGLLGVDTLCTSDDILALAGVETCPFESQDEDGEFACEGDFLIGDCPVHIRFEGRVDIVEPEKFLLVAEYEVISTATPSCLTACESRLSFTGKWLNPGGCRPGQATARPLRFLVGGLGSSFERAWRPRSFVPGHD